jgi:3-oxoacyl-[acyl-carrier-protein] synthase II
MGEGAAVLVLESEEHALARGAKIYCELAGFGQTDDAGHITAPDKSGNRPAEALRLALKDARVLPEEVDYVNAHGTSTMLNDMIETLAIKRALGKDAARKTCVSSSKSMLGHLVGAASAIEAVICALTLQNGVAHATANLENPDLENGCDLDYIPSQPREKDFRVVISNSLGFGGHNVCLAFRKNG